MACPTAQDLQRNYEKTKRKILNSIEARKNYGFNTCDFLISDFYFPKKREIYANNVINQLQRDPDFRLLRITVESFQDSSQPYALHFQWNNEVPPPPCPGVTNPLPRTDKITIFDHIIILPKKS